MLTSKLLDREDVLVQRLPRKDEILEKQPGGLCEREEAEEEQRALRRKGGGPASAWTESGSTEAETSSSSGGGLPLSAL